MGQSVFTARLVERQRELDVLSGVLHDASDGRPSVTVLAGEAGIGKSRLTREIESRAEDADFMVLRGDCVELGGAELPYAAVSAALRDIPASVLTEAWSSVPHRARGEIESTFPHVAVGEPRDAPALTDGYAQARLYESLFALLRALSADAPLLLVVEDFHWADRSTRDFIEFLARNLRRERVAVVITYRTDQLRPEAPVRRLVAELRRVPTVRTVDLERLSRSAVAAQLAELLGEAPRPVLVDDVYERSGGNPFFAEELLASWLHKGAPGLPASLTDALLARYRRLSAEAQRLLRFAAAMRGPVDMTILGEAADVHEPGLTLLLRECGEHHLFSRLADDDRFAFRHELVREAIYGDLLPAERAALHRAIARTLAARERNRPQAELAFHWRAAGHASEALVASVEAGLEAERAHAFGAALDHFEAARTLWEELDTLPPGLTLDRFDVLAHAADLAKYTGDSKRACQLCDEAINASDSAADPVRMAGFYERRGRCESYHDDAGLASYREAIRLMPDDRRADRARLMSEEGFALTLARRSGEALERCTAALDLAVQARAPAEEGYARMMLGVALGYLGDTDAGERQLREAQRLARDAGRAEDLLRAQLYLAEVLRLKGLVSAALSVMVDGEKTAEAAGMYAAFGRYMSLNAASDLFFLGRWDEAAARIEATADVDLEPWDALMREQFAGQLALARGELEIAQKHLERARRLYGEGAPSEYAPEVYAPLAELALWRGRHGDARAIIREGLATLGDGDDLLRAPMLFAMGARVEAAAGGWPRPSSDADRLRAQLDRLLACRDPWAVPPAARAHQASCHGEAAAAGGQPSEALWRRAADAWHALGAPYPEAYATWRQAESMLLSGHDRLHAARVLAAARTAARRLRAQQLLSGIDELAGTHRLDLDELERPTPVPRADPAAALGLTPREAEVLLLVSQGLTNREIAEALVISERTAAVHVSRIFAKLGVHNRVAAVAAAQRAGLLPQARQT